MAKGAVRHRGPGRSGYLAVLVASAVLATTGRAMASPKLQAIGETSVGYTDNIQSAPDQPIPGQTPKAPGAFVLLSPGVVLAFANQRNVQRIGYTYLYSLFFAKPSASSSSNRLEYHGFFDLNPRSSLLIGATAVQSNTYSSVLFTAPGAGAVNALPPGGGSFLATTTDEILSSDIAPGWRAWEGASMTVQAPIFGTDAPSTLEPTARVGAEHAFLRDAVGLEARGDYAVIKNSLRPDGTPAGVQRQLIAGGVAQWRHDWGRYFTSRAEAGPLHLERLNTDTGFWFPSVLATLAYGTEFGDAQLSYGHTLSTNPLLGQSLLVDEVRARGALPLTKKGEVLIAGSLGYQNGRLLDADSTLAAHVDAILADAAVAWQVVDELLIGIRYQHIQQISDVRTPPLPISFVRNAIMLGATLKFPPESDMPHAYRAPLRVDRTDEIRDAVEPGTPGMQQPGTTAPGR
jgi:hypothetical protein